MMVRSIDRRMDWRKPCYFRFRFVLCLLACTERKRQPTDQQQPTCSFSSNSQDAFRNTLLLSSSSTSICKPLFPLFSSLSHTLASSLLSLLFSPTTILSTTKREQLLTLLTPRTWLTYHSLQMERRKRKAKATHDNNIRTSWIFFLKRVVLVRHWYWVFFSGSCDKRITTNKRTKKRLGFFLSLIAINRIEIELNHQLYLGPVWLPRTR